MRRVWIAIYYEQGGGTDIIGVFDDKVLADAFARSSRFHVVLEEHVLNIRSVL